MDSQCQHVKPDGTRCKARALSGSTACFFHSPETVTQRREARRQGGRTRNRKPDRGPVEDLPLGTVAEVVTVLGRTINDVRAGRLEAKVGNAVACLVGQLLAALRGSDLDARLRALEEKESREHPGQPGAETAAAGGPAEGAAGHDAAGTATASPS
jgi:hypothetical protein